MGAGQQAHCSTPHWQHCTTPAAHCRAQSRIQQVFQCAECASVMWGELIGRYNARRQAASQQLLIVTGAPADLHVVVLLVAKKG